MYSQLLLFMILYWENAFCTINTQIILTWFGHYKKMFLKSCVVPSGLAVLSYGCKAVIGRSVFMGVGFSEW